jgi:hypothetical protein
LSTSATTTLLVELVDADMLFVELVDVDMMATIVVCRMVDCRVCCCCWMDLIKVQLLGNEGLSQVCFLEVGHFGLMSQLFGSSNLDLMRPKKQS